MQERFPTYAFILIHSPSFRETVSHPAHPDLWTHPVTTSLSSGWGNVLPTKCLPDQSRTSCRPADVSRVVSGAGNDNLTTATYGSTVNLNNGSASSLSTGAIAGIVVGGVVFLAVIAATVLLVVKLRNPRITESFTPSSGTSSPLAPGV